MSSDALAAGELGVSRSSLNAFPRDTVSAEVRMSRINGEKARSAIAKRNRTAMRAKARARLAEIKKAAKTPPAKQA